MKITYISTYPPRECGLATFNKNLMNAISSEMTDEEITRQTKVIALNTDGKDDYDYPDEVKFVIRQQNLKDYAEAAVLINASDTDACILQHEFGIYGGESGIYVLPFISDLEKPLITILHTVLKEPSFQQKIIIQHLAKKSDKVVVMGKIAIKFLTEIYGVSRDKISYIEHGVPDVEAPEVNLVKSDPLFKNRTILLTFGLINRNKGLETVIRALPKIKEKHPDVLYVVLGNTHPGILKNSGEEYRDYLKQLAAELDVTGQLAFVNRYVAEDELINYLAAADIYVTPYINEAQITSGTLSYAVGAGAAVVSTPYWHAKELLVQNRGQLFDFNDDNKLADIVNMLLDDKDKLSAIKMAAYQYGLTLRWPVIGGKYRDIIETAIENPDMNEKLIRQLEVVERIPEFSLGYIKRLTDSTGIIQHAKYGIPNLKEGYCIDDNARALIMTLMAIDTNEKEALELIPTYLSFIHYMQTDDGNFRNFLNYSRQYVDETYSEDAFGRTIWSLGYLISNSPNQSYREFGEVLFRKSIPHFDNLQYLRGISNTLIGVSYYLRRHPSDKEMMNALQRLTARLVSAYDQFADAEWKWFEGFLSYDNAILPLSLLHSAAITRDKKVLSVAFEAISFLEGLTLTSKYLNPVGNNGWYYKNGEMPLYDQQAIETMGMVLLYSQALQITGDTSYLKRIYSVYMWFLGENSLWAPLYDSETTGCSDGLQISGINLNQGAESTLAYLISHLSVLKAFEVKMQKQASSQNELSVY